MKFVQAICALLALGYATPALAQGAATQPPNLTPEAAYIYKSCSENGYQKRYYKCDCVATAFQQARKGDAAASMAEVVDKVLRSTEAACANTAAIAMSSLTNCTSGQVGFANQKPEESKDYCTCVAAVTVSEIHKKPMPQPAYHQEVQKNAYETCKDPAKRAAILKPK